MFSAVLTNYTEAQNAANTAMNSSGSAVRENERYMESLEAKVQGLKAAFQEIVLGNGGLSQFIGSILDATTAILKFLNSIDVGKWASVIAIFGVGGKLVQGFVKLSGTIKTAGGAMAILKNSIGGLKGAFLGLEAAEGAAAVGATALTSSLAPFLVAGGAVAIIGVIASRLTDTGAKLENVKKSLKDTEKELSNVQKEYDQLLTDLEKTRLEYLEKQLGVLKQQTKEQQNQVTEATEKDFKFTMTTASGKDLETGIKGLEGIRKQLGDTQNALDNYTKAYDPAKETISEYNKRLGEHVNMLDGVINEYYNTLSAGNDLTQEQRGIIDSVIEQKTRYAELTGTTADFSEAEMKLATINEMTGSSNGKLSSTLRTALIGFLGVEGGSDAARAKVAAYRAQAVLVSNASMSPVLSMDRNALLNVANAAGVATEKVFQLQIIQLVIK